MIRRVLVLVVGALLIVLGFVGYHVEVVSVVAGLILVGALSGEQLADLIRRARSREPRHTPSASSEE